MAHRAQSSSSITYKWTYDVFLSFYGDDTRLGFISHLCRSLHQSGIHAFIDDEFIRTGEKITPSLFKAIEESRIAIVVFSENYANSTFCLEELVKILECFKEENRLIYPVFYHVDPSELRRPRGSYAQALVRLEERFKDKRHTVEKWRLALSQAADLKGCHLKPKIAKEQEFIARITNEVATRINQEPLCVTNYPVGLVPRVKEVISCLDLWSTKEIIMIGIWGAGGIGKSTIARAVYNSIADNFEGLCFLSNVRKQSKMPNGLSHLQETLLCKLVMEKDLKLGDYHEGIPIIEHRLPQKKILLILDDVDKSDQLEALAGSCNWFGCGSRIIITTRNKQLLASHDVKSIYDVKELNDDESLKLLSWYAFKKENVDSNYTEVCNRTIHYSCGFPLALEVIGSSLRGKGVNHWSSALDQFQRIPHERVLDALKLSYDALGEVEKNVFLDLACFFNGEKLAYVNYMLLCFRGIQLEYAIEMLIDKSIVKIERDCVTMHDLIEDIGKEIVRQESSYEPGERSRLWFYQDILHVLQQDTGTNKVEAIILDLPERLEVQWSGEEFMKMKNLKMLVIRKACFSECPKYLPNSLRWLEWKGYPFKFLPYHMCPTELVYLDLSYSYCELLQPFDKKFYNLSRMNLRNCKFLQQIPNLSGSSNLRELWLDGCTNLIEIHDSVGCLNKLRELSAMRCKNLKILPSCLQLTSLKHLNLFSCSSLQRFPEISVMMEEMQTLDLDKTAIAELPSSICNLIGLEILNVEHCRNLKQLPSSICTLPNLWKLTANFSEGMSHFKMCEGGGEASLDCSAMSLKMEQLCFSNCNLSDGCLAFCLSYFTNLIHLDLSFNNFTTLPECIKEYHKLRYLLLDNCNQLQHIGGIPPNLEKFSAICCTSLTKLSKSIVLNQALNFQAGKRNFIFPGKIFPKRLHNYSRGSCVSFWVRDVSLTTFLWILVKDEQDYVYNCKFSVHINGFKLDISSKWLLLSTIKTNHIYISDMRSIIHSTELPLRNKWNQVKVFIESKTQEIKDEKDIYFGVHVCNLQSNVGNIPFMAPRRFVDHNMLQKIQEQEDWKEPEEDMNLDLKSTKPAESIENPVHYQDRPQDREELEGDMHQDSDLVKSTESLKIMSYQDGFFKTIKERNDFRRERLPNDMQELVNLWHLDIGGTGLSKFTVDKESTIEKLGETSNLKHMLAIQKLENIENGSEAYKARMIEKKIKCLYLSWSWAYEDNVKDSFTERDIMDKLQPHWDLEKLEVRGYRGTTFPTWLGSRSYHNLIDLCLTCCKNCWRIPALGQLPALRSLIIERFQSVVAVGSEFFNGHGCTSVIVPFPSLETLYFGGMFSWEEWNSFDMDAFPKLLTLRLYGCPRLIGSLPRQLVSLKCLEIIACPLLASSVPKCPKIHELLIFKSQNLVLQVQELPPSLRHLQISGATMLDSLSEKLHNIEDLCVRDCPDEVQLPVIRMPPSVKKLRITDCENLKFVFVSEAPPLVHLRRISIYNCKFLTSLFDDMERLLPNVEELSIERCPEMEPFSPGFLPSSLKQLELRYCDKLLSCHNTEWPHLPSLTKLLISTRSETLNCRGFQNLTSLQELKILDSPKLEKIEGGMMPPSLQRLLIWGCSLLIARCRNKDGEIWPKISHVPYIILH